MNYENPTSLRIGKHGILGGKDFRVLGRVVMGATIGGEIYFWNEFNLRAEDKTSATLVFEGSEDGGEWRLFTEFEPEFPMSAAEAAVRQVGDQLNLTGENVRVTLVQTSQVYRIEGEPPDDTLKVGSVANYFNAEASGIMQVVSWTGEVVEYYSGLNLANDTVEKAFDLRPASTGIYNRLSSGTVSNYGNNPNVWGTLISIGMVVFFALLIFGHGSISCAGPREASPVRKIAAASVPLAIGTTVKWNGTNYQITAHALTEIAAVGRIYERHEYTLTGDDGNFMMLSCGNALDAKNWILYQPLDPLIAPTPTQAAAQKLGDIVNVDGIIAVVSELFQSTVRNVDSVTPTNWHKDDVRFNYLANADHQFLLVSWNQSSISLYRGKTVLPADFKTIVAGK